MTWINIPDNYDEYIGFVYVIEEKDTGMKYIGIKKFWKIYKKKPTKYKLKNGKYLKDKKGKRILNTRSTKQHIKKETDWRNYNSSSPILQPKIEKNPNNYTKKILHCCSSTSQLKAMEAYLQLQVWMDGDWDTYYNKVINLRITLS